MPGSILKEIEWSQPVSQSISISGDFNDWKEEPMTKFVDTYFKVVNLEVGRIYSYKFNVDGKVMIDSTKPTRTDETGQTLNTITINDKSSNSIHFTLPSSDTLISEHLLPVTLEKLNRLQNEFELFPLEFKALAPSNISQTALLNNGSVMWLFPSDFHEREPSEFQVLFPEIRVIDSIDLDICLSRPWVSSDAEYTPRYLLTIRYEDKDFKKGWITALKYFDLTGLISNGETEGINSDKRVRRGSINLAITTRKLILQFSTLIPEEKTPKESKPKTLRRFEYKSDFDTNGVLYYIGSNGGKETWTNPALTNKVNIEISHEQMFSSSMKKEDIISRNVPQSTYWGGTCPQYFTLDLGSEYRLLCDYYTLRHGFSSSNSFIKDWQLLGSNDCQNWTILHEGGETPFSKQFDTKSFIVKNSHQHFRYFRVLQKGNYSMGIGNTSPGSPYLCIGGFELYGELISATSKPVPNLISNVIAMFSSLTMTQSAQQFLKFEYKSDFDTNGIIYYIGTEGGKHPWVNPATNGKLKIEISHPNMYLNTMKKEDIISRTVPPSTYWGGSNPQYVTLDLGPENRLRCNYYTLRHGYAASNSFIKDWQLLGSHDGKTWTILHEGGETPFSKQFDTKSFPVKGIKEFYRYFRVLQKGNYSMGIGQPGGSPYLCIGGIELYGERYSPPQELQTVDPVKVETRRIIRDQYYKFVDFHVQLLLTSQDKDVPVELRQKCLEILTDIWLKSSHSINYIDSLNLSQFLQINILYTFHQDLCIKASRLLSCAIQTIGTFSKLKIQLLNAILNLLPEAVNKCVSPFNLTKYFDILSWCWNIDSLLSQSTCIQILLHLGNQLYENRSPFYNILRTHYGLYGYVLENDVFEILSTNSSATSPTPSTAITNPSPSSSLPLTSSSSILSSEGGELVSPSKNIDVKLHFCCLEFNSKKRALTSLLEEIIISGDQFSNFQRPVTKAYDECMSSQAEVHKIKRILAQTRPGVVNPEEFNLDRWNYVCSLLLEALNTHSVDEEEYSSDLLDKIFTLFCVYGTPALRNAATRYLINLLDPEVPFLSLVLQKFFSTRQDASKLINIFPQQEVFTTLQEIMKQDRLRFFYVDELFSLLEDSLSYQKKGIDTQLVSWILLLLSSSMVVSKDPIHQGSKCRGCNMSPICGVRYRCVNCLDYDLCGDCESNQATKKHPKSHLFVKIPKPLQLPPSAKGLSAPKDPLLPILYPTNFNFPTSPTTPIHSGVSCDGCGANPIKGIRYKCVHCDQFNYCQVCEEKIEHFPSHLFLKIYYALPNPPSNENPKALIPVLLHTGFYPQSQFNLPVKFKFDSRSKRTSLRQSTPSLTTSEPKLSSSKSLRISQEDEDLESTGAGRMDGKNLRTTFSVIFSSVCSKNPLPDLLVLASQVLEGLAHQYLPDDILQDIFCNPQFDHFLHYLCFKSTSFIRSVILKLIETLCSPETYINNKDIPLALKRIRDNLREKSKSLLISNEFLSEFLLELLLIVTTEKDINRESNTLTEYPLDQIAQFLVSKLSLNSSLTSNSIKIGCMGFRLLQYSNPIQLVSMDIFALFQKWLTTSEDLQSLLKHDFSSLLSLLLSQKQTSSSLQTSLFHILTENFSCISLDSNSILLLRLVRIMKQYYRDNNYNVEDIFQLLHSITNALPKIFSTQLIEDRRNKVIKETLELIIMAMRSSNFTSKERSELIGLILESNEFAFSHEFINWLSKHQKIEPKTKKTTHSQLDLKNQFNTIIKLLSIDLNGAKHFLKICLNVLQRYPNSIYVAELTLSLLTNEELCFYFAIELQGYLFLFDQIQHSRNSSTYESGLSSTVKKALNNNQSSIQSSRKPSDKNLQSLANGAKLLEPKNDSSLVRLIQDTPNVIWSYNFQTAANKKKFSMVIELPNHVVLRSIHIDFLRNYSSTSRVPSHITIETGNSLTRMLPIAKFPCTLLQRDLPSSPYSNTTHSFKFLLPEIQSTTFVRIKFPVPHQSTWVAINRIQFLGYSSLLNDENEILVSSRLPLVTSLELLEQILKFEKLQLSLSKANETFGFSEFLLNNLGAQTNNYVHNILCNLAKHDAPLSDTLLKQVLTCEMAWRANLAGRLCGLGDLQSKENQQLNKLRDFVFQELENVQKTRSLSSHLMPFLNALASTISNYQWEGVEVDCPVTDSQLYLLFESSLTAFEGSFMQQGCLRLLSALIQSNSQYYMKLLNRYLPLSSVLNILAQDSGNNVFTLLSLLASTTPESAFCLLQSQILTSLTNHLQQIVSNSISTSPESEKFLERCIEFFVNIGHHQQLKNWLGEHVFELLCNLCSQPNLSTKILFDIQDLFGVCSNLNTVNQNRIASFLLEQFKKPKVSGINGFMLQLMVNMFSFEDKVTLSLHSKTNSEEELEIIGASTSGGNERSGLNSNETPYGKTLIVMDKETCSPSLEIESDGVTVVSKAPSHDWRTVVAEKGFSSGVHKWDVIIEKCTATANIMIGVCEKTHSLNNYIGQTSAHGGWSYYGATTGYTYHNGNSNSNYGQKMQEKDVIGVVLDMDEGTLSFSRNGEDLGIAFSTDLVGRTLYPAVSLYDPGDRVRFHQEIKGRRGGSVKSFELDTSSPLIFHREGRLLKIPTSTKLRTLSESLLAKDTSKVINFEFHDKGKKKVLPFSLDLTFGQIVNQLGTTTELLDLWIEITNDNSGQSSQSESQQNGSVTSTDSIGSILKQFAEQDGLVYLIETIQEQMVKRPSESLLNVSSELTPPNTPKSSKRQYNKKKKSARPTLDIWKQWLKLFKMQLKVGGCIERFVDNQDCRLLLFEVMTEAQGGSSSVRQISENFSEFQNSLPKLSDEILNNPLSPLINILVDLLKHSCNQGESVATNVRGQILESGILAFLLMHLTILADHMPRNPDFVDFVEEVRQFKEMKLEKEKVKKQNSGPRGSDGKFWAKGTGYGTTADDSVSSTWHHDQYIKEQTILAKKIEHIFEFLAYFFQIIPSSETLEKQPQLPEQSYYLVDASCLIPLIENYYRNDSLLDMSRTIDLYRKVLHLTRILLQHDKFLPLLDSSSSIYTLISKLHEMANIVTRKFVSTKKLEEKEEKTSESKAIQKPEMKKTHTKKNSLQSEGLENLSNENVGDNEMQIAQDISLTFTFAKQRILEYRRLNKVSNEMKKLDIQESELDPFVVQYRDALKEHQFMEVEMFDKNGQYRHHYKSRIKTETTSSSKKTRRIMQELSSLSTGLPLHPDSAIFLRVDTERPDVMKCLITGPRLTPYENGCFIFDIYCPPDYPANPPVVNLITTGGGSVRFNPNLYNCGKVCLSLLGTWNGGQNEKWNENASTLLQVFISIQSLILVEHPYFNEPGYESNMNTQHGMQQSTLYNENIKIATLKWAMIEQIKSPPVEFEDVVKLHFKIKRNQIVKQCSLWLKEASKSKTNGHFERMKKLVEELTKELENLDPTLPLEEISEEELVDPEELARWNKAVELTEIIPGFPLSIYVKALEISKDKADAAVSWLLDKGDAYQWEHPELITLKPPKKADKALKFLSKIN